MKHVRQTITVVVYGDVFTATTFQATEEPWDFDTVRVDVGGTDVSLSINDMDSAVSLVKAASEAVEFFAELEARKAGVQDADE